jgi:HSP20 family protein
MPEKSISVQRTEQPAGFRSLKPATMFEQMDNIFNKISRRAYELFESDGRSFGRDIENWFRAESELLHPVHIELNENETNFQVKAEVPGFTEKDLDISLEGRTLTIAGKRETSKEEKTGKKVFCEHCADQILKVVELPAEVDADKVKATLHDGMLSFELPKAVPARKVKIETKAA